MSLSNDKQEEFPTHTSKTSGVALTYTEKHISFSKISEYFRLKPTTHDLGLLLTPDNLFFFFKKH